MNKTFEKYFWLIMGLLVALDILVLNFRPRPPAILDIEQQEFYIETKINEYRAVHYLPIAYPSRLTCDFAKERLGDIQTDFSHDGFKNVRAIAANYFQATENLAEGMNYKKVVDAWIQSPGHERNLLAGTDQICVKGDGQRWVMIGLDQ